MKRVLSILALLITTVVAGQVQREDGTLYDDQLGFHVVQEHVRLYGEINVCIWQKERELCIENLITSYEILIYNQAGEEIWTSLWTGMYPDIKFEKNFPDASYIIIRAKRDYVINIMTGTRIYTDGYMELKYDVR